MTFINGEKPMPTLRAIIFREGGSWVGQCLEYDIVIQAEDAETARERLTFAIQAEARYTREKFGEPFVGIDPAPVEYEHLWRSADAEIVTAPADQIQRLPRIDFNLALVA